ncbi:MAG TPA: GNAT family N-acetyltransferase [Candidatus Fimadaptatus faecigallinarum]|uniref:GNAT family N-acetyltransferase n=1 Tax=Candidatus Fimadaptatus faecigallinarum TaxID=2840814 RepID=A0A9D1LQE7_9FIRM|nr:GNAT family N-acetyltransferase [Candidatus Fimadaptatus faecigallinarum]
MIRKLRFGGAVRAGTTWRRGMTEGFFHELPELETERLKLRKLRMSDAQDMYEYSRDPEVARHVLWDAHTSVSETRGYLRYALRQYRQDQPASWGIELKQTGRLIGTIGFMWINRDHNSAEVGYSLARAQWNKGLMSEALEAVLEEGFMDLGLHRIEAQHEVDNPASGRVMVKCGMLYEGCVRGRLYNKGRYVDVSLYAILRDDYLRRRKAR